MRIGIFLAFLVFLVYRFFLSTQVFVAPDWPLGFAESRNFAPFWSIAWDFMAGSGLGGAAFKTFWIDLYTNLTYTLANFLNLPWWLTQRIFWIIPFVILVLFSSYCLSGLFFKEPAFRLVSAVLYSFNTYILMVVAGGQFGIAFAYAILPLTLAIFLKSYKFKTTSYKILSGLILGLNIIFDPRIGLLALGVAILYIVFNLKRLEFKWLAGLIVPVLIATFLNSYWLLPLIFHRGFALAEEYTGGGMVSFLSFAKFENAISLLHPNWPENIFGKTYFMRAEFLLLPILAFSALIFVRQNINILFFATLGLIGAFLAKGANPPFGQIYIFLSENLPGFNLFRDPTKFYTLVALSYSILITFSFEQISERLRKISNIKYLVLSFFIVYWLFLIRPAWLGQLGGTFKPKEVPGEYLVLKEFIAGQEEFFRTFWIPKRQRFGFFSPNHPAIEGSELLTKEELTVRGVKYVIVPYDSEGEIFLKDRKYDYNQRLTLEKELDKVSWLKKLKVTDKIAIYENHGYKDHFWTSAQGPTLAWEMINPTKYKIQIKNVSSPFELVFSEGYDKLWQAKIGEKIISSKPYDKIFNSFSINKTGNFEIIIEFAPQRYVSLGLVVSMVTFLTSVGLLGYLGLKGKTP